MHLSALTVGLGIEVVSGDVEQEITGIAIDSRRVEKGFLFVAYPGNAVDGRAYISAAIEAGAVAILTLPDTDVDGATYLSCADPQQVAGALAKRFYREQPEHIVAVTGTNGKTSIAHFCRQLWALTGHQAVSVGTVGVHVQDAFSADVSVYEGMAESLTTPDVVGMHQLLEQLSRDGINYVALEASSHGLDQGRLNGVNIQAAAFSNITRDHLDYHKTFDAYLEAKKILFTGLLEQSSAHPKSAFLQADSSQILSIKNALSDDVKVLSYGEGIADLRLADVEALDSGYAFSFIHDGERYSATSQLLGRFQIENMLAAIGLVVAAGVDIEKVAESIGDVVSVRGRMERIADYNGAVVLVDYAHTPDALKHVLQALRPHVREDARLHVVFGCGGDRDQGKRMEMGQVAVDYADAIVVTDDNPRSELPALIRAMILEACPFAQEIANRKDAIETAMMALDAGDVLVVAGKGHETYQEIEGVKHPFDDAEIIRKVVAGE